MSNKTPIFPISNPQHFSDYGFDPQINYFQVLEEAMKHKQEATTSINSTNFKLQKPISKEDSKSNFHKQKPKKRWWKTALFFFKRKWAKNCNDDNNDIHQARAKAFRATMSGSVYLTESRSGSNTPVRTSGRPSSGALAGGLTAAALGAVDIPYLSLRELTVEQQQQQRMSTSAMHIYLVT